MAFDFPSSPTVGQIYQGYTWDGEKWVLTFNTPNTAGVIAIKVFTASGTYVPSPNMTSCVSEGVGGGGGGGGCAANGSTNSSAGGGGGAGSYSRRLLTASAVGLSLAITIGAAGVGATAGANNGGNGGDTSIGALLIAKGGQAGFGVITGGGGGGGAGGVAGTGDIAASGAPGMPGFGMQAIGNNVAASGGSGGSGPFGGGGLGPSTTSVTNGNPGTGYGSGGSGGASWISSAASGGSPGAPGIVVITEYGLTALGSASASAGEVRYDLPQTLTGAQQAQAQSNIGVRNTATASAAPSAPAGTVSTSAVMMGMGATCKITPQLSGRVQVFFIGAATSSVAGNFSAIQVRWGTGAAPANGVAPAGTAIGQPLAATSASAGQGIPYNIGGVVTGLTPGTPYWFDIGVASSGASSTAGCGSPSFTAIEF
jgi:hypothetical protein